MAASALVYLTSLHPDREQRATRGGPSGEMAMAASLLAGLSDLGFRVDHTGTLRGFLGQRAAQFVGFRAPDVAFFDPWSLALAVRYRALPPSPGTRVFVLEWFGTSAAAIPSHSALAPWQYLTPYPYPELANSFLGFMLRTQSGTFFADGRELREGFERTLNQPRTYGVVWGKERRYFGATERSLIRTLAERIPMHLTVAWGGGDALEGQGIVNHGCLKPDAWRGLLREARFVLGLGDPILGPTALEALAAGAVLLNPAFAKARLVDGNPGVSFKSQHPFAAAIGEPHVQTVDLAEPALVVRTVDDLLAHGPSVEGRLLPPGLEDFTRDAYVSRLAALLERPRS